MKILARISNDTYVIPCKEGNQKIDWLISEIVKRHMSKADRTVSPADFTLHVCTQVRLRNVKGAILYENDHVADVLVDDEEVILERSHEKALSREMKHIIRNIPNDKKINVEVDGCSLTIDDLVLLGSGQAKLVVSNLALQGISKAREFLDEIVRSKKVTYGVNTGFGKFARTIISDKNLIELQENLIRSHAAGVGRALSIEQTRMLFALRINILSKGYSGISAENVLRMVDIFNAGCMPLVPEQGTVGASGDLAPLSHLALGLLGEGKMWSAQTGWANSSEVLKFHGLKTVNLGPKEGLALINGTQLITSVGCTAVYRAQRIARQADIVAALTLESLKGIVKAFDPKLHAVRLHKGQNEVAARLRAVLRSSMYPSGLTSDENDYARVQDCYSLRCIPQVHGVVHDTIKFVSETITNEMNSATDNPIVFWKNREIISGGNFHGEYPAKMLDYLAIGVHELANISERRIERMLNPGLNDLPAFLVKEGGLNSGFMIAHCTAAALVSENKVLTHPSSVDSISTSAAQEDHVSMGGFAARKALQVVEHVEQVVAIELLAACQAIDLQRPLKTTEPLEKVHALVRSVVKSWDKDRYISPDIEAATRLLKENKVWEAVEPYVEKYNSAVEP
ncbi:Histidine ammonia-lyase [Trichoplax sp. H2]|nr:Histidine ammonia-lyase [Trichoplax sp. H2]|eukprot:RDD45143.1 Histidine ammonia-lyase [Trichoplax sp. H2]